MSLFVKKFGKYLRRSFNPSSPYNNFHKSDKAASDMKCYNYDRPGHFAADCNRPKKEERYRRDEKEDRIRRDEKSDDRSKDDKKTAERYKERSKDRRMRARTDKKPSRKYDRKVLVAEERTKRWVDTDSDSTSSSSSSSDSEQEEVHCLMADQTSDGEGAQNKAKNQISTQIRKATCDQATHGRITAASSFRSSQLQPPKNRYEMKEISKRSPTLPRT
ncbi:hypothetical protein F511_23325 [Dorcoceras hygrometricum]|uniref:CCHC-type domain-containing protein n=1 Tax=Dorcoceras hygrometricum TaxID=472368 RepID=A0A2Z7AB40_9LAMI|nr:hypothetical protein F511_23325 [Dorcoceras hygrometricum]